MISTPFGGKISAWSTVLGLAFIAWLVVRPSPKSWTDVPLATESVGSLDSIQHSQETVVEGDSMEEPASVRSTDSESLPKELVSHPVLVDSILPDQSDAQVASANLPISNGNDEFHDTLHVQSNREQAAAPPSDRQAVQWPSAEEPVRLEQGYWNTGLPSVSQTSGSVNERYPLSGVSGQRHASQEPSDGRSSSNAGSPRDDWEQPHSSFTPSDRVALNQPGDFRSPSSSVVTPASANRELAGGSKLAPGNKLAASATQPKQAIPVTSDFILAAQPKFGEHYKDETPLMDRRAAEVPADVYDFAPDPNYDCLEYDPYLQADVYHGKKLNANQRPLLELGRPWYQLGQFAESSYPLGFHNPVSPQFIIYGDARMAVASHQIGNDSTTQFASQLNLNFNLQLTGTERFHLFVSPLTNGGRNNRYLLDDDVYDDELDFDVDFGFFEGDLGAIVGGWIGETLPFDLPFAVGVMPLLAQNGVWLDDAFLGAAVTIPARNSRKLGISNYDITFFAGYDEIISPAFELEDDAARMYGMMSFIEALNGYIEIDYAYLEDRTLRNRSYHNIGLAYSRRFGRLLSHSTRVIFNAGQSTNGGDNTADGVLLLSENSLITGSPSTVIPYFNLFAGFDRPQSAARNGLSGGVLRNTGILFESDNLTGYPTLDASANDTYGAALGLNLLASDFSQQLILEAALLGVMGDAATRNAVGDQYGLGLRYQLPLTNAVILRADAMYGFLRGTDDIHGVRLELRHKF